MKEFSLDNRACRKFLANIFGFIAFSILFVSLAVSPSYSQSCAVTSMESGKEIRACQMEDMRNLVNQARAACAVAPLAPYAFSDQPLVPGTTAISVRHLDDLKQAITEITTQCGSARPAPVFKAVVAGDIISVSDFVNIYNSFVAVPFCGDSICQTGQEDLTTCPVDCGGTAQFYCNGIGGCYAGVLCPAGKRCYTALQGCLDNAPADCAPCVPVCSGPGSRYTCESWSDGCGGLCWGTKSPKCECADTLCSGQQCTDVCGGICNGKLNPDCSCAGQTCTTDTCSDGCGGTCIGTMTSDCSCASNTCIGNTCMNPCDGSSCAGTKPPDCSCANNTCAGSTCSDGCGGTCAGTKPPDCSCASDTCVGFTCSDGCGGTCAGVKNPSCSCQSSTCWDDVCDDGCGGICTGTKSSCSFNIDEQCGVNPSISVTACGNNPDISGYYFYRCDGNCTPTDADLVSGLIANCTPFVDSNVVNGQKYTYAAKFYNSSNGTYSAMSGKTTHKLSMPDCSCASSTCIGDTCSNGCGGTCPGTKAPDCSCASSTCIGDTCLDGCGGTCAGTIVPDCSCASSTCIGDTCLDGCGGECAGTQLCVFPSIECKKWTCSGSGFCLQDYTATCSCPAGSKPVCRSAPPVACGGATCPDTMCDCVT